MPSRRSVLLLAAGVLALGCTQRARSLRVGYLWPAELEASTTPVTKLRDALRDLGYVEGRNLQLEVRSADENVQRLPQLAAELVEAKVDVVVAAGPPAILAASRATRTIPIVMAAWGGPGLLESGLVATMARPGGNVTGVSMLSEDLERKRLELLIEAMPGARRVAVLYPGAGGEALIERLRPVASAAKVELSLSAVPGSKDYALVFGKMSADRIDALLVPTSTRFYREQSDIIESAARFRIPAIYEWGDMARNGGMIGYGSDFSELFQRTASFIDRIFKGADPGTLPVEQPVKFDFVINQKTARALGVDLPKAFIERANEVVR